MIPTKFMRLFHLTRNNDWIIHEPKTFQGNISGKIKTPSRYIGLEINNLFVSKDFSSGRITDYIIYS
jgi:hypothetical protein